MRVLYLIRRQSGSDRSEFRDDVLSFTRTKLMPLADHIVVAVTESAPPRFSVIPFRSDLVALISMEGVKESHEGEPTDSGPKWPVPPEGFAGAYLSETAWPVVHERTWELGERSPGAGLFTMFRQKKGLPEKEFLERWYNGHTPLTLEVHPNVGYVRNRVTGIFPPAAGSVETSDGTPEWDGIVEEQYDPPSDLLRARQFFGGSLLKMLPTMMRVYFDVKGFIDYSSIETWLTAEYRLK